MLAYPATIPLSSRTLNHLAASIRRHRNQHRSRWRRLDPGVTTFADKGYQGAGGTVRTPFKRHRHRPKLSRR
ncbi:hypothetical protein GCM10007977_098300 [Dactylosporangium sucinum]|uniref:DDE Tnp4 domain-containing protein n=1 Tax=Dactylosporangium sucinum TaxID=1424081 RepID=A0A917X6K7_9ACTN|nr:hypothetical protein GCM10007977_098300 [Dactylosporangium sucinum]